jgi:hypothetical protein
MKKLTPERREIVLAHIKIGFACLSHFKAQKLSVITDEGRRVIQGYWVAQQTITDAIGTSMTRTEDLIMGRATLDDFYDETGKPKKIGKTNG